MSSTQSLENPLIMIPPTTLMKSLLIIVSVRRNYLSNENNSFNNVKKDIDLNNIWILILIIFVIVVGVFIVKNKK